MTLLLPCPLAVLHGVAGGMWSAALPRSVFKQKLQFSWLSGEKLCPYKEMGAFVWGGVVFP